MDKSKHTIEVEVFKTTEDYCLIDHCFVTLRINGHKVSFPMSREVFDLFRAEAPAADRGSDDLKHQPAHFALRDDPYAERTGAEIVKFYNGLTREDLERRLVATSTAQWVKAPQAPDRGSDDPE